MRYSRISARPNPASSRLRWLLVVMLGAVPAVAQAAGPAEEARGRDLSGRSAEARRGRYELYRKHARENYHLSLSQLNHLGVQLHRGGDGKIGVRIKGDVDKVQQNLRWHDLALVKSGDAFELKSVGRYEGQRTGKAEAKKRYDFYRQWAEKRGVSLKDLNRAGVWLTLGDKGEIKPIFRGEKAKAQEKLAEKGLSLHEGRLAPLDKTETTAADKRVSTDPQRKSAPAESETAGAKKSDPLFERIGSTFGALTVENIDRDRVDVSIDPSAREGFVAAQLAMLADQMGREAHGKIGGVSIEARRGETPDKVLERYGARLVDKQNAEPTADPAAKATDEQKIDEQKVAGQETDPVAAGQPDVASSKMEPVVVRPGQDQLDAVLDAMEREQVEVEPGSAEDPYGAGEAALAEQGMNPGSSADLPWYKRIAAKVTGMFRSLKQRIFGRRGAQQGTDAERLAAEQLAAEQQGAAEQQPATGLDRGVMADFGAVSTIEQQAYGDKARAPEEIQRALAEGRTLVYLDNDRPLASATFHPMMNETNDKAVLYIERLATHPEAQRHGIGSALLTGIEQSAGVEGLSEIRLHIPTDNAPARAFLEKLGYQTISNDPAKGDLMSKVLNPPLPPEQLNELQAAAAKIISGAAEQQAAAAEQAGQMGAEQPTAEQPTAADNAETTAAP